MRIDLHSARSARSPCTYTYIRAPGVWLVDCAERAGCVGCMRVAFYLERLLALVYGEQQRAAQYRTAEIHWLAYSASIGSTSEPYASYFVDNNF